MRLQILSWILIVWLGAAQLCLAESPPSIDGTYELTERIMADGTVRRPPDVVALYTMAEGRFNLNLFVKNRDGTIGSESTVGRYTFGADKYLRVDYLHHKKQSR